MKLRPRSCTQVRSRRFLEIIEEEKLVENAATVGQYLVVCFQERYRQGLIACRSVYGTSRRSNRNVCTTSAARVLWSLSMPTRPTTPLRCARHRVPLELHSPAQVQKAAYEKNLLILLCGSQSVRFRPPLDMSVKDVDVVIGILETIFVELGPAGKARI